MNRNPRTLWHFYVKFRYNPDHNNKQYLAITHNHLRLVFLVGTCSGRENLGKACARKHTDRSLECSGFPILGTLCIICFLVSYSRVLVPSHICQPLTSLITPVFFFISIFECICRLSNSKEFPMQLKKPSDTFLSPKDSQSEKKAKNQNYTVNVPDMPSI